MERLIIFLSLFISLQFQVFADDFSDGIESYNKNDYTSAIQDLEKYIVNPDEPEEKKLLARAYLGASQFILGNKSIAAGWFLSILKGNPEYELNPVYFPPEIISFFNEVKDTITPIVFKREEKHFYLNFFPFGAGQFQNHEFIKGAIIAGVEVIALSVSLDTYFRRKSMDVAGKYPEDRLSEAKKLQNVQIISGGIFIAGYIYGVIDGSLNYKKNGGEIGLSFLDQSPVLCLNYRF